MSRRITLAFLASAFFAAAQTGPDPGRPVPNFSLEDQNGEVRTLQSVMGPKGLLLVFFRSADW
jgi:hypothetical protein